MCWSRSSKTLSWLGVMWGLLSLITLLTAFLTNVWLYTKEPIRFPNSDILTTVTFKIGLWKICPTFKRTNATPYIPHHSCTSIKYSSWEDITATDLGISSPLEFTPSFLSKMRISTLFGGVSIVFILSATGSALLGIYNNDHKTILACGLFMLGGLTVGGGLLIFASVLSDAYFERPKRSHVISDAFNKMTSSALFDYKYGWSFFAAGAAFFMAELAAVLSISAYVRRFPTVEDMVRVMVPGADRRLKERHGIPGECLVQHKTKYQRQDTPVSLTSSLSPKSKNKVLSVSDFRRGEEAIFMNKPAPDICTSNPAATVENIVSFCSPPASSEVFPMHGDVYGTKSVAPCVLDEIGSIPTHSVLSSSPLKGPLAGQTVPIVLMNHSQKPSGTSFILSVPNKNTQTNFKMTTLPLLESTKKYNKVTFASDHPTFKEKQMLGSDKSFHSNQFNDCEEHLKKNEKFNFGLNHQSSGIRTEGNGFFETFWGENNLSLGLLDQSIDNPTSSTFSSGSGTERKSGMSKERPQSCLAKNKGFTLPERKKKVVTIGNVFSKMETSGTDRTDCDSTESKIGV